MIHCHSHSHPSNHGHHNYNQGHRHHHPHRLSRSGSDVSRDDPEQYSTSSSSAGSNSSGLPSGNSGVTSNTSSSDYSLAMSSDLGERTLHRNPSTASLLDSMERRTQRTYRYGIGLVCVGATLNWLGFAQGTNYIDPLRYMGVACVLTGSFCVCLAMCRWLSKPIAVSGHHATTLEEERSNADVHVINVAVPMYVPTLHDDYRPTKPPDYEQIVAGDEAFPPPYDEAVKLRPSEFFGTPTPSHHHHHHSTHQSSCIPIDETTPGDIGVNTLFVSHFAQPSPSQVTPSHHHCSAVTALLLDHHDSESIMGSSAAPTPTPTPTPRHILQPSVHHHHSYLSQDPPPAYEPSPRPSITSCSSSAPLIPTPASRFDLPPSFSVRRIFGGGSSNSNNTSTTSTSSSPRESPSRRRDNINISSNSNEQHLHDQVINENASLSLVHQQNFVIPGPEVSSTSDNLNANVNVV